ncbi:MAG: hypothetical protein OXF03_01610 [Gammaproteobacteria bacterium]|nr:hypothetical protein [Gammaproteobacteria bacterium]MCY4340425.1 hypothetical protein [Gammaproteobacteria bacterium]
MKRLACQLIGAAALFIAAAAETDEVTGVDRFKLWNDCMPMKLGVENLDDAATEIGLKKEAVETTVRSRLRAARLFDGDALDGASVAAASSILLVRVTVVGVGHAFSISVEYMKRVIDIASEGKTFATTWKRDSTGTHGLNSGYILSVLSRHTDKFIDEYLRVNEDACSRSP